MTSQSDQHIPLIVIVGPTASGKTALAIELAKRRNGEIICADSRTVYKGMDIGTAKPTQEEQGEVPHWGLDLVVPGQAFSVADFKVYALQKIEEVKSRGHVPILAGGTGLYVDAVIYDYDFGPKADPVMRQKLEEMSLGELYEHCSINNISLPENTKNKRYVIRAIERNSHTPSNRTRLQDSTIIVGIATSKEELLSRIHARTEHIFKSGVVEEANILGRTYGWQSQAMTSNIYPLLQRYIDGELTLSQVKVMFTTRDWQFAKRQLTWLRRNDSIIWLPREEIIQYLETILAQR